MQCIKIISGGIMKKGLTLALAFAFVFIIFIAASSTVKAGHVSCGSTITTDTTLDSDLSCSGTAIAIGADNVVLDCQGHKITGVGTGFGIQAQSRQNIIIQNCVVQNFAVGISFVSTNQSQLINNAANSNRASENRKLKGRSTGRCFKKRKIKSRR